jgi:hypothetical protein
MKLFLSIMFLQLVTTTAFADAKILCNDPDLQDAQMTLLFEADEATNKISVSLGLPTGKSSAESHPGDCDVTFGEGDWDIGLSCKVVVGDVTYSILLEDSDDLTALVASSENKLPPYRIPCRDLE